MKVVVMYHSVSGNTQKVAQTMAEAIGCRALPIGVQAAREGADVLFLGGAVYATSDHDIDPQMRTFIENLDASRFKEIALFCTGFSDKAVVTMRNLLVAKKAKVIPESFFCKGKLFKIFNMGHPNDKDLVDAAAFAKRVTSYGGT